MFFSFTFGGLLNLGLGLSLLGYSQSQKLTNIDYVGIGYDVLTGNPHNHLYDPGKINLLMNYHFFSNVLYPNTQII